MIIKMSDSFSQRHLLRKDANKEVLQVKQAAELSFYSADDLQVFHFHTSQSEKENHLVSFLTSRRNHLNVAVLIMS